MAVSIRRGLIFAHPVRFILTAPLQRAFKLKEHSLEPAHRPHCRKKGLQISRMIRMYTHVILHAIKSNIWSPQAPSKTTTPGCCALAMRCDEAFGSTSFPWRPGRDHAVEDPLSFGVPPEVRISLSGKRMNVHIFEDHMKIT